MERKRLLELAISGVRQELNLLENELVAISKGIAAGAKTFIQGPAKRKKRAKKSTGGGLLSFRRKPKFSAAERKRRADRMKRYWAERRKAAKK